MINAITQIRDKTTNVYRLNFTSLYCMTIVRPTVHREYGQTLYIQTNKTFDTSQDSR